MKFLICVIFMAVSSTATAVDTQQENVDKVLERVDAAGQWFSATLEKLADKLGTTVAYLWPTYVKQVMADGIRTAVMGLFLIALGMSIYILFQRKAKDIRTRDRHSSDEEAAQAYTVFSYILLFALLVIGVYVASSSIPDIVAPEPVALKNIVDAVKQLK